MESIPWVRCASGNVSFDFWCQMPIPFSIIFSAHYFQIFLQDEDEDESDNDEEDYDDNEEMKQEKEDQEEKDKDKDDFLPSFT